MKTINYLKSLNQDERQILGGGVVMVLGFGFLVWLQSTNSPAMLMPEKKTEAPKKSYELPKSHEKYANKVYNAKFK